MEKVIEDIANKAPAGLSFATIRGASSFSEQNRDYSRMAATYDLFYRRFPEHDGAKIRVCTITARCKDCAELTDVEHLRVIDVQFGVLALWIRVGSKRADINRSSHGDCCARVDRFIFLFQSPNTVEVRCEAS